MEDQIFDPELEPQPKKKSSGWLIGCAMGVVITICVVSFVLIGGFAGFLALFPENEAGLSVSVSSPANEVNVSDSFQVTVQITNTGSEDIEAYEIKLPNTLLESAALTSINPSGLSGVNDGSKTSFNFTDRIAAGESADIVFSFTALQSGDLRGAVDVVAGSISAADELRVTVVAEAEPTEEVIVDQDQSPMMGDVIPYRSVVQIIALVEMDGQLVEGWSGSGTIISEDGLILTNAHVILSDRYYNVVDLVVAITMEQDAPPVEMFFADVIQADARLDLAVIKVRSDLNGAPANFSSLGIEPVPLGNSDSLGLGDEIIIIGYPGIGGQTITLTRGEVSGFTSEDPYGNRAFIKTSATIAGGNSGGLAATVNGEIIGVPTQVGSGDITAEFADCRRLVDTNRDGFIDELDNCVPTGGFINALRPIRLALPLIEAARSGQVAIEEDMGSMEGQEYEPEGDVILYDEFTDNANDWGLMDDSDGVVDISGGKLRINVLPDQYYIWTTVQGSFDTFILVTEATVLKPRGDGDFGFICGVQDGSNFVALEITEDGYYSIWKMENGQTITLVDWAYSDEVANSSTYTIAAYCGADRLALAVNDVLLTETVDPNYQPGAVGLIAGTYDNPDFQIGFENFFIFEP